mmetsp:Transcript_35925/g.73841  ORF Transcript_35925/g.73841 Transcript_35925/m.73841 type:complete len:194 (-) Transcript_35925:80-661(-)
MRSFSLALACLALLVAFAAASCVPDRSGLPNEQQQVCARPPRGCQSQRKRVSCTNWHGCQWKARAPMARRCQNDNECSVKATRSPTLPPTCVTDAPTPAPNAVSCKPPSQGCGGIPKPAGCKLWSACRWKGGQCRRNYNKCAFRSCDVVNGKPAAGCASRNNRASCNVWPCCKFKGGKNSKCVETEAPWTGDD